jgi:opacity protein-like surface antigen
MSGNLIYREPGETFSSNTNINTSTLFLTLKLDYRDVIDGFFFVPVLNIDLGATINFDSLNNYPLGWNAHKYDPEWMLSPGMVNPPGKVNAAYLGFTGSVMVGLDFPVGESFSAYIKIGATGLTKNTYGDLFKFGTSIGFLPGEATKLGYGIVFQAGAKVLY